MEPGIKRPIDHAGFISAFRGMSPEVAIEAASSLVDSFHVPIVTFSTEAIVTSWNAGAEALYGIDAEEAVGTTGFELVAGAEADTALAIVRDILAGRQPETRVLHHRRADTSTVDVILAGSAISDELGTPTGAFVTVHEFTPASMVQRRLSETEGELRSTERALTTLSRSARTIVSAADEPTLLSEVCRIAVEAGGYGLAFIGYLSDDAEKAIVVVARAGEGAEVFSAMDMTYEDDPRRDEPAGRSVREGRPIALNRMREGIAAKPRKLLVGLGVKSCIGLPLADTEGTPIGVLGMYANERDAFDEAEVQLLSELAASVGHAIESLRTQVQRIEAEAALLEANSALRGMLAEVVQSLGRVVEARDPYTQGHQERVAHISEAIASEMGLAPDRIEGVVMASLVHDVGKLAVPAEILNALGRLGEAELALVHRHSAAGADILRGIEFPWPIADIVLQHHERKDGTGYPSGLAGDEILLEARIIGVADVVEAMASDRPHRPALGLDVAIAEVSAHRERYDAAVVDALDALYDRGELNFEFESLPAPRF